MLGLKSQVYSALSKVCENVTDAYPKEWKKTQTMIQYTEEDNSVEARASNVEIRSKVRYRIDIWNKKSTTDISIKVDEEMSKLGLVRTFCKDITDASDYKHKMLRYEGIVEKDTEIVYYNI